MTADSAQSTKALQLNIHLSLIVLQYIFLPSSVRMGGFRNPINWKPICLAGFQEIAPDFFFFNPAKSLEKWNSKEEFKAQGCFLSPREKPCPVQTAVGEVRGAGVEVLWGSGLLANTCILSNPTSACFSLELSSHARESKQLFWSFLSMDITTN